MSKRKLTALNEKLGDQINAFGCCPWDHFAAFSKALHKGEDVRSHFQVMIAKQIKYAEALTKMVPILKEMEKIIKP